MEKNNKDTVLFALKDAASKIDEAAKMVTESNTAVERVTQTLREFGAIFGLVKEEPTLDELNAAVDQSLDAATQKAAEVATEEAAKVIEKKVEEVKATQTDESAKLAVAKVKDEAVKEVKEVLAGKKEEIKKQAKDVA